MRALTLVSAPAVEPVTADEAKNWLKIDDDTDDPTIQQLITTVRTAAEQDLRRSIITQSWKLTLDLSGNGLGDCLGEGTYDLPITALYGGLPNCIDLPKGPVQSVTSVVTYALDNTPSTYASSNYLVDTAGDRLVLNYGAIWPAGLRQRAACEVTYVTGYGATSSSVPSPLKHGMLIHLASIYEQRGMCADAMSLPPGTRQLYGQYRIIGGRRG